MKNLSALCFRILLLFTVCTLTVSVGFAGAKEERKAAAGRVASEIARHNLHKIYLADFLERLNSLISDAARTDKGCYFASVFSTNLSAEKSSFDVLNRIDAQRLLTKAAIRPDLLKSETFAKVAAVIGVDALLMGTFRQIGSAIALELSLREATTGKELYHTQYQEQSSDEFEALFPAATDSAGTIFYFADLDGIGSPECLVCSNPSYTRVAGDKKTQGAVLLSAVFKVNGQLDQARVARSFEPSLDQTAMEVISNWKVEPAKDAAGNSVPVRRKIAVDFSPFNSDAGRFGVQRDSAVLPRAGVNGFGVPACVYCPVPNYSNEARADKSRGTVLMDVVVTAEGRATDVIVIKGSGDGLEEKAMEAVKSWRFRPAKDATGNPVAVRVQVEVTFNLGN
jgi:TonB family protein